MKPLPLDPLKNSTLATAWQRWRAHLGAPRRLSELPSLPVPARDVQTLSGPDAYRQTLLELIAGAERRILIAALYLQDDDAGREVLAALYAAKKARPSLEIAVFVDWHRAQRGLIGKAKSEGNAALYRTQAERLGPGVTVYGVPVQRREFLGVLHLKGFVIDDQVLYSGASLNDVYLQKHGRYRLDRYHLIRSAALADSLAALLTDVFLASPAVCPLDRATRPQTAQLRPAISEFRHELRRARYILPDASAPRGADEVDITPLLGLGLRRNELNAVLLELVRRAKRRLILLTPYFNLPGPLRRALDRQIRAGCRITVVVGDKTANDFYIPPDEPYKTIGALPYLYEANLRRFCQAHRRAIERGQLEIRLWRHGNNTYHLKGLLVDDDYALITGNNLNPRAWRLDLENGLLIHDPKKLLRAQHEAELARILEHTERVSGPDNLECVDAYPAPVQRLVRRLARVRADRLVNQML